MKRILVSIAIPALLFGCSSAAQKAPVAMKSQTITSEPLTWHDGKRVQRVWMNPSVVVAFGGAALVDAPGAQPVAHPDGTRRIRLFEIDNSLDLMEAPLVSPVFHEGPHTSAPIRALPGGVVVHLDASWTDDDVATWAASQSVTIAKRLPMSTRNIVVIDTEPGLPALSIANELRAATGVSAAYPDWWRPKQTR